MYCEMATDSEKYNLLFDDLCEIHDLMTIKYLNEYLKSNKRLRSLIPIGQGELIASKAAFSLYRMLEGFPQYKYYNDMEAIESCRRWMEENKDYKFKENGQ